MKHALRIFPWKFTWIMSALILICLVVLNFYGFYTDRFYLVKFESYLFILLALTHGFYLYVINFKLKEKEFPDNNMRNLEYFIYVVFCAYLYKFFESYVVLLSHEQYTDHTLPSYFKLVAGMAMLLYFMILVLLLISFAYRKFKIGKYNIDYLNGNEQ